MAQQWKLRKNKENYRFIRGGTDYERKNAECDGDGVAGHNVPFPAQCLRWVMPRP